jgi:hypothetical protein
VEQVVGGIYHLYDEHQPEGSRHQIVASLGMIRAAHPYDWAKQFQTLVPGLEEVRYAGKKYYKSSARAMDRTAPWFHSVVGPFFGPHFCFYVPDDRTIVIDTEKNLRHLIKQGPAPHPRYVWAEGWKYVDRGLFAAAVDNRDKRLAMGTKKIDDPVRALMFQTRAQWVLGVGIADDLECLALANCDTDKGAEDMARLAGALLFQARLGYLVTPGPKQPSEEQTLALRFARELAWHTRVQRQGKEIRFRTEARDNLDRVLGLIVNAEVGQE